MRSCRKTRQYTTGNDNTSRFLIERVMSHESYTYPGHPPQVTHVPASFAESGVRGPESPHATKNDSGRRTPDAVFTAGDCGLQGTGHRRSSVFQTAVAASLQRAGSHPTHCRNNHVPDTPRGGISRKLEMPPTEVGTHTRHTPHRSPTSQRHSRSLGSGVRSPPTQQKMTPDAVFTAGNRGR